MQTKEGAGALFSMPAVNDRITRFVRETGQPVLCFGFGDCTGGAQASFVTHPLVQTYYFSGGDCTTNFHTYALTWASHSIQWSVDGAIYQTQTNWWSNVGTSTNRYPYPAPFDQPFYILMNLAIGGNYLGNPSTNQINPSLPGEMILDYVRVYDSTPPLAISMARQPDGGLALSWPIGIVCHLQRLASSTGLNGGTGWVDVAGAGNPYVVYPAPGEAGAYYRLASP
jgi:beta-glucanase (GH16 family)